MDMVFASAELMSAGELISQTKQLLAQLNSHDWGERLLDRIKALGLVAVAAPPAIRAA
jgi:hypothetical protein